MARYITEEKWTTTKKVIVNVSALCIGDAKVWN